jgi:AraC-like DNA-binding protein/quercetin dioxygenase-like cupin family protein
MGHLSPGRRLPPEGAGDDRLLERLLSSVSCSVLSAGWYCFPPEWVLPERVVPNAIVYVFVGGRAEFVVDGERHRLGAGDILLTAPDLPHTARNDPNDPTRFYTTHFVSPLYGVLDMTSIYGLPAVLRPGPDRFELILQAIQRVVAELDAGEPGCALAANGECARILALLWRETVEQAADSAPSGEAGPSELARLGPVFRTIQAGYAERLTLKELAGIVHLDPAYFSTLFKRVTGLPPLHYVARYRLQQVRHLLLSTDNSVRDIASATGFRDPFYLSRVFRRAEGISPSEYRRTKKSPGLP